MSVKHNLDHIQSEIAAICERVGRSPENIHIVAVTKYVSVQRAQEALEAGIVHFGENRHEGLEQKRRELGILPKWHFIGSLQSKKVKHVVNDISYLHSLDRLSLASEVDKRLADDKKLPCFVQVNVSAEESKSGLSPDEVIPFIEKLVKYPSIVVIGLMTMAPFVSDVEETRPIFKKLKQLQMEIATKQWVHAPCTELSMGMSNDYQIAIEEGATFIRVGTALVGKEDVSN
ncbi:YggS family pyridoxal phosphate-dependent enzyme [Bacillus sp. FJAT-45037]|uniref:YggS family pyridoxal phosphate-dependent enzyme n=1 Tax=Bacillus sp. FJAT-45037 TaxID=2011007 RepID=UPI000C246C12|nr:YggS family pyridoxal phosphate-dependent enzyme [Bacillus sp. FJAT-45037]